MMKKTYQMLIIMKFLKVALSEAKAISDEDVKFCENIGLNGLKILEEIYNKKKDTQLIF